MFNKKGSEMIEAAVIMPIVFLITISMLNLGIFAFNITNANVMLHNELRNYKKSDNILIKKISLEREVNFGFQGFIKKGIRNLIEESYYQINEANLIRGIDEGKKISE